MHRRQLAKLALSASAGVVAAPAIVRADTTFNWRMTSTYGANAAFNSVGPGSATDLCKRIEAMSGGRLKIRFYGAGELMPALAGFDACSAGTVEMNYGTAYFWTHRSFAAQYFAAVPFGLDFQGFNGWLYEGGGLDLYRELYDRFNLMPFVAGNTGVQMTGWFRKPLERTADLAGIRMRVPGLAGDVYRQFGVEVKVLPANGIVIAFERGEIDAAEFVGPYLDRQLGLQKMAKYYYTTGWHEPATAAEIVVNKAAWASLPDDLKAVVENACAACNVLSEAWCHKANAEAMADLVQNQGIIARPLPPPIVQDLRTATAQILEKAVAKDPEARKVNDSYFAFLATYRGWSDLSEKVYYNVILG